MSKNGFAIEAPEQVSLEITGTTERFPVRRIYCVGRNYVAHVREMGGNEDRDPPIFFQKPTDAIVLNDSVVAYPTKTADYHHEMEMVIALKSGGYNISEDDALSHIYGYGVALDMTRRDIQGNGKPWEIAKSFDQSCPCGPITPADKSGHIAGGEIKLTVNGETRQVSDIDLLIWKIPEIIANLSTYFELKPGDIILTGTPHGVGPVKPGDVLVGTIAGLEALTVRIGQPAA
ncbi:fumarylacetoacetate hydrolase family protein [Mesorhizobium sp. SB112]|uniref:fumarylacetoacetate hydrolase family protein n=1 Tax=Mesorhizobium sp. SB112 TaxID=3151853 RepID=UPI003263E0D1